MKPSGEGKWGLLVLKDGGKTVLLQHLANNETMSMLSDYDINFIVTV